MRKELLLSSITIVQHEAQRLLKNFPKVHSKKKTHDLNLGNLNQEALVLHTTLESLLEVINSR